MASRVAPLALVPLLLLAGCGASPGGASTPEPASDQPAFPLTFSNCGVEVTLDEAGTISAVEVTPQADGGNSEQFQEKFAGGIADVVVGKKITELDVSKVSGSSLTSGGFNAAIAEITADAAA